MQRNEVNRQETWDLSHLYPNKEAVKKDLDQVQSLIQKAKEVSVQGEENLLHYTKIYEEIQVLLNHLMNFEELYVSTDYTDLDRAKFADQVRQRLDDFQEQLQEVEAVFFALEENVLEKYGQDPRYGAFFQRIQREKAHYLGRDKEEMLKALAPVLDLPVQIYEAAKFKDLTFPDFQLGQKIYPLSFSLYEDSYAYHPDKDLRRGAYVNFSNQLTKYEESMGQAFLAMVKRDLALSRLRGYPSVFDYMLRTHQISRKIYDDHLDTIMEKLAPIIRDYAQILKARYNLDEMTYADLKLSPNPQVEKTYSMEEAKDLILKALAPYGEDYVNYVSRAFPERWIDYADNEGKSTGGFCASPYQVHSYILMTYRGLLSDVFTLVHELGHAGHFHRASDHQSILCLEPSLYFVESPSTTNELVLKEYLLKEAKTPEERQVILGESIANTYYHNFVTHFLEAYFQREVYRAIEGGEALQAKDLSRIFLETLEKFFGKDIFIPESAGLTWMRQPHYYEESGFYSYTYSAGLSLGTLLGSRLTEDPETCQKWLEVLAMGGSQSPQDLAGHVGIDITSTKPLEKTISIIKSMVDEMKGA